MEYIIGLVIGIFAALVAFITANIVYIIVGIAAYIYLRANELEDECARSNWTTCEQYMNSNVSWTNKWALDENGDQMPNTRPNWMYLWFFVPAHQERFWLSTTLRVWKTDGEHLFQKIKNTAIFVGFLAIGIEYALIWFLGKSLAQLIKELNPGIQ